MTLLGKVLSFLAMYGFILVLAGAILALCVRNPRRRRRVLRPLLIVGGILVGSIFLASAYGKMRPLPGFAWTALSLKLSLTYFAMQVGSYEILSPAASNFVAHTLPFFELFLGLWLVSGIARRYASLLAAVALLCFMSAITYAYLRGLKINCGCGIGPDEQVGPAALLRDGLRFLAPSVLLAIGAFYLRRKRTGEQLGEALPSTARAG